MKETHAAAGHEQVQRVGGPLLQHSMKDSVSLCPMSGPLARGGKEPEEEGAAERSCYVLSTTPIPYPSVVLPGRGG